jgi:putative ABC transport system permease protein
MPKAFWFPSPAVRIWLPQQLVADEDIGNFSLIGRVATGLRIEQMATPIAQLTGMLGKRFQYAAQWDKTRDPWVKSVRESFVGPLRPTVVATFAAMGMILLIACANVAALMLGQVEGRTTELAVRSALGATRRRIATQLVTEALILGVIAGGLGAFLAGVSFRWLTREVAIGAWAETASLDWHVFAVAMTVALGSALAISLVPTVSLWRGRLRGALGASRTVGAGRQGVRVESMLVIVEVALAVLMTAGAGLLLRSLQRLYAINPGSETHGVGVVDVMLPADLGNDRRMLMLRDITAALRAVPGIKSAAVVQRLPLRGGGWSSFIIIEGKPDLPRSSTYVRMISAAYLETMGIGVTRGRAFDESDMTHTWADSASGVVVINEALARKYYPGENPIGRTINTGFGVGVGRIIGVVRDVAEGSLTDAPSPVRYVPYPFITFTHTSQTLVYKVEGNQKPEASLPGVRAALTRVAPRVAIQETTTLEQELARAVGPVRRIMMLVALLTAMAVLLGAIGIYGVMSHFVSRRRRDWGIRIALGLSPARVLSGVVVRGTSLVGIGIGIGLAGFVLLARLLTSLIYGVGSTDPLAIGGAAVVLMVVGAVAALVPALRASQTDPAIILREQ